MKYYISLHFKSYHILDDNGIWWMQFDRLNKLRFKSPGGRLKYMPIKWGEYYWNLKEISGDEFLEWEAGYILENI